MLPDGDNHGAEYRRKAEECFEQARRAADPEKEWFLKLAETWARLAAQSKTLPALDIPIAAENPITPEKDGPG